MRNIFKHFLIVPLFVFVFSITSVHTFAGESDIFVEDTVECLSYSELPNYYVSPYVTSDKNQGDMPSCSSFAKIACAESFCMKNKLYKKPNFSEAYTFITNGLSISIEDNKLYKEKDCKYNYKLSPDSFISNTKMPGKKKKIAGYLYISDFRKCNKGYLSEEDINYIKQLVLEYGGCYIDFYFPGSWYKETVKEKKKKIKVDYLCYPYTEEIPEVGHAVEVIGWDDNLSADNFKQFVLDEDGMYKYINITTQQGAFLIKDSTNATYKHKVWLSYGNFDLLGANVCAYKVSKKESISGNELKQISDFCDDHFVIAQ